MAEKTGQRNDFFGVSRRGRFALGKGLPPAGEFRLVTPLSARAPELADALDLGVYFGRF
jgi:hypothetical protein